MNGVKVERPPRAHKWNEEFELIREQPGQWFKYEDVCRSTVTYLKAKHRGFDVTGRDYREGNRGRSRCDMYVRYTA